MSSHRLVSPPIRPFDNRPDEFDDRYRIAKPSYHEMDVRRQWQTYDWAVKQYHQLGGLGPSAKPDSEVLFVLDGGQRIADSPAGRRYIVETQAVIVDVIEGSESGHNG